jgi:hypothetical protein
MCFAAVCIPSVDAIILKGAVLRRLSSGVSSFKERLRLFDSDHLRIRFASGPLQCVASRGDRHWIHPWIVQ